MTEKKKRSRKPKAVKTPVEIVKDSPTLDSEKMEEEGFEKVHARDDKGHFIKDDPSTPENEAFEWVKEVEPSKEIEIVFTPDPELDIVFTPDPEVFPEPEPESKIPDRKDDPDMYGLTQTRFGRGKQKWRRRTRRLKGD